MIDRACISLTDNCNLRCRYCHFQDKKQSKENFDTPSAISVLDRIHEYCSANSLLCFKLGIVGSGEPMIKKDVIFQMLYHITENDYSELQLYTVTNGTLITREDLLEFFKFKDIIKLCFSLDGHKELHEPLRSGFDSTMKSISIYKEIFGEMPGINATVSRMTIEQKERATDFFLKNQIKSVTFSRIVGDLESLNITKDEFKEFLEYARVRGLISRQHSAEKKYDCTMYGKYCGVGRTNIFITPSGIYPCGRFYKDDKYLLGNYTDSLTEVEKKMKSLSPVPDGECYYDKIRR